MIKAKMIRFLTMLFSSMTLFVLLSCAVVPEASDSATKIITPIQSGPTVTTGKHVLTGNLHVLTLNVAHGRKEALNQLVLSENTIRQNLMEIAALLKQAGADIVALQEVDGPSRWSGNFDHVELLAHLAEYPWYARATHAQNSMFEYGTALLSNTDFVNVFTHSFSPSPPTSTKGFVLGQIEWLPDREVGSPVLVDILSVHLDFSRANVRRKQIDEMMEVLSERKNSVVILGDFNDDWSGDASVMDELVRRCHLHAYQPLTNNLGTYRKNGRRLDWILVSQELDFKNYEVMPDVVSDHNAVVAEVYLNDVQSIKYNAADNAFTCDKSTVNR